MLLRQSQWIRSRRIRYQSWLAWGQSRYPLLLGSQNWIQNRSSQRHKSFGLRLEHPYPQFPRLHYQKKIQNESRIQTQSQV